MKDKILALRNKGYSYSQIRKELNCSLSIVSYYCGDNQKQKGLDRQTKRRKGHVETIRQLKLGPCVDCGNRFHPVAMDFDHINDNKTAAVSRLIQQGRLRLALLEIEKCELVCSNCHRIRTLNRREALLV